jgi:hypothetical protein
MATSHRLSDSELSFITVLSNTKLSALSNAIDDIMMDAYKMNNIVGFIYYQLMGSFVQAYVLSTLN